MTVATLVVGSGAVAQRLYRKPLQRLERLGLLRVVGLVDPATTHADQMRAHFPQARVHADIEAALAETLPALTLILTPAHLHCAQTVQALRAGSHVLCEKPMAESAEQCARMNLAARDSGRVLAVGMIRRFFPAFTTLRELLASGRLGTITAFEYREGHKFDWDVTTPAPFRPRKEGGTGVLFDIGPHVIDHLEWTFGELQVVSCRDDALAGIESNASIEVRSASASGAVHLSWDGPQTNELRVRGSRGQAVLRVDRFDQLVVDTGGGFEPPPLTAAYKADLRISIGRTIVPRAYADAIYAQLVQMLRAIRLGEAPGVDGTTAARSIALLEAALRVAEPLPAPWLSREERASARRLHWSAAP